MSSADLFAELRSSIATAVPAFEIELQSALKDIEVAGGEAAAMSGAVAKRLAGVMIDARLGRLTPELADELTRREISALSELAAGLKERSTQLAVDRARRAVEVAAQIGLALAKAALL